MAKRRQAHSVTETQVERPQWAARLLLPGMALALVLLLAAAVIWLLNPHNLPLRTVRVEGVLVHVTPEQIRAAVAPFAGQGFVHIDIAQVRAALERLPWIYSVQVTRSWPDALLVAVQEQKVLARWGDGGLVNVQGDVFRPQAPQTDDRLPLLQGPPGTSAALAMQFAAMRRLLVPLGLAITRVTMDDRRAWSLMLADGVQLMLGRSDQAARIERFVHAYPQVLAPRIATVARVDLRYTNGFAVQWREHLAGGAGRAGT